MIQHTFHSNKSIRKFDTKGICIMSFTMNILIALVFGVITSDGLCLAPSAVFSFSDQYVLNPVGQRFLNLIMMLVGPIVFVSIVLGAACLSDPVKLGKIGVQTIT